MKSAFLLAVLAAAACWPTAQAYELTTHAAMIQQVYSRSKLDMDPALRRSLGIEWYLIDPSVSSNPFGATYFDVDNAASRIESRQGTPHEGSIINRLGVQEYTLPGWLMRGGVREDDHPADEPNDDPYGNFFRMCNHFFDPTRSSDRGAHFLCPDAGVDPPQDAASWAFGANDAFASPLVPNPNRRNHFSLLDARESLYRAVTGRSSDGGSAGPSGWALNFHERKTYWATLFRALGDLMHLNQDMAQPQHTRDEMHLDLLARIPIEWSNPPHWAGSAFYEKYIEARVKGEAFVRFDDGTTVLPDLVNFGNYPVPRFDKLSDYWSTAPGTQCPAGNGLADYSSRGFFTDGNNFGATNYQCPRSDPSLYQMESITSSIGTPVSRIYSTSYYVGQVPDSMNGDSPWLRLTVASGWDDFVDHNSHRVFTMDRRVYDAMASALVPRAVAYSVGILDHFFRGRMQIDLPDEGVYGLVDHSQVDISNGELLTHHKGFGKLKLKLSAPTAGFDGRPQQFLGGRIVAVLKFRRARCPGVGSDRFDLSGMANLEEVDGSGPKYDSCRTSEEEVVVSAPANDGQDIALNPTPKPLTFEFPDPLPLNATDVRLQVVYRGALGDGVEGNAVVVATQDLSEPTFFSYMNASDYNTVKMSDNSLKVFTRDEINEDPSLLDRVYPQSCVDRDASPARLRPGCFNPFDMRIGLRIANTDIQVDALPVRRFIRIAVLHNAGASIPLVDKAFNTCISQAPYDWHGMPWQDNEDPDTGGPVVNYPILREVRGVYAWYGTSCAGNASNVWPFDDDNRDEMMADLSSEERVPFAVQINGGSGF